MTTKTHKWPQYQEKIKSKKNKCAGRRKCLIMLKKKTPNPFFEFEYKMVENIRENFRKI